MPAPYAQFATYVVPGIQWLSLRNLVKKKAAQCIFISMNTKMFPETKVLEAQKIIRNKIKTNINARMRKLAEEAPQSRHIWLPNHHRVPTAKSQRHCLVFHRRISIPPPR